MLLVGHSGNRGFSFGLDNVEIAMCLITIRYLKTIWIKLLKARKHIHSI